MAFSSPNSSNTDAKSTPSKIRPWHTTNKDNNHNPPRNSPCTCIMLRILCSRCRFCSGMRLIPCPRGRQTGSLCRNCKSRDEFEPGCGRCRDRISALRVEAAKNDANPVVRHNANKQLEQNGPRQQPSTTLPSLVLPNLQLPPRRPELSPVWPPPTSPSDSSSLYSQASLPRRS
ncbi:hypothetical protein CP533_3551 [Ophiocordyceps camponoti-saundersi (nom. inval.)]|nr:hypothetical protein CP533_3551 [Ophiocordyceps camponoti-saundersi (nom. inval.)]